MKAAEILRKLADMIDQHSTEPDRPKNSMSQAELEPVEVDNTDQTDTTTFVAPLQQKLELLKKSVGVDNIYDDEEGCDELEVIKNNAGIPSAAVQEMADDDGPVEG